MNIMMIVLVIYLLISNCYLHYKVSDIEREIEINYVNILELIFKDKK